jgi:hypothetical protein
LLRRIDDSEKILSRTIDQDEELTAWKKDCEMDEKHQETHSARSHRNGYRKQDSMIVTRGGIG